MIDMNDDVTKFSVSWVTIRVIAVPIKMLGMLILCLDLEGEPCTNDFKSSSYSTVLHPYC